MNRSIILLSILIMVSCSETKSPQLDVLQKKQIEVEVNRTVETFMILRSISDEDPLFRFRKPTFKGKPIMYEARTFFADAIEHPAVKETQQLLRKTSSTGDLILQALLYFDELPSTVQKHQIDSEFWKTRKDTLTRFISTLSAFYRDAGVDEFLDANKVFYAKAIREAKSYLDDRLIPVMEEYFGIENGAYKMILIPNSPFGMGFGASTKSEKGDVFYQIIAPANDVEWNESSMYDTYGFSGEGASEYYRDLVVHEFCHPFITPFIGSEKWKAKIAETDSLFVPKLDAIMSKQGYGSWWGFVNEHLVRLAEIRIAKKMGIEGLEAMRNYNIEENGFVLIPDAEELIMEYESDRDAYKSFHDFIPRLIEQFGNYDKHQIEEKIQSLTKQKQ